MKVHGDMKGRDDTGFGVIELTLIKVDSGIDEWRLVQETAIK